MSQPISSHSSGQAYGLIFYSYCQIQMAVYFEKSVCFMWVFLLTEVPQIPEWPGTAEVQGSASGPFLSQLWAYEALGATRC